MSKEMLNKLKGEIEELVAEMNGAIADNDFNKVSDTEQALKDKEGQYALEKSHEIYDELYKEENPIKSACVLHSFSVVSHKNIREDGMLVGVEVCEKMRQINLVSLCKYLKIEHKWEYTIQKFNYLLCIRVAQETKKEKEFKKWLEEASRNYSMNALSKAIELGETPTSNTQMCKVLQRIIDEMFFDDDGKGKNITKVNNRDVNYLLQCYTKKSKTPLAVTSAKHSLLNSIIMDIAHKIILDKDYTIEYKVEKEKPLSSQNGEVKVVEKGTKKTTKKEATVVEKK